MSVNIDIYSKINGDLRGKNVTLIAVSKTKPIGDIKDLYDMGQRDFGENYVQELCEKQPLLPQDIHWHFIGHLQTNKVKYIAPFVHLIHGVDSMKLLREINKQGQRLGKTLQILLQLFVASEETKFGMDAIEIMDFAEQFKKEEEYFKYVRICGVMGMASLTSDQKKLRLEFSKIREIFEKLNAHYFHSEHFSIISMGMSGDYEIAVEEGSNMVRIGSLIFGSRT